MIKSISCKSAVQILVFSFLFLLYSCKHRELLIADQSQDLSFYPIENGNWAEFEVDSIVHFDSDDAGKVDTAINRYHFYIREEVDSFYMDGENQKTHLIKRYRRENDTFPWTFINLWTVNVNPYSVQRVEDNIRFIRLQFPINANASWKGNAYNYYPEEDYSYEELYQPRQYGSLYFDSTITVLQNDFVSHINRIYKKEIYGAHAGLLFKQIDSVNTLITTNGTIILNGLEYRFKITAYNH